MLFHRLIIQLLQLAMKMEIHLLGHLQAKKVLKAQENQLLLQLKLQLRMLAQRQKSMD
jgi:hypothetical protein